MISQSPWSLGFILTGTYQLFLAGFPSSARLFARAETLPASISRNSRPVLFAAIGLPVFTSSVRRDQSPTIRASTLNNPFLPLMEVKCFVETVKKLHNIVKHAQLKMKSLY